MSDNINKPSGTLGGIVSSIFGGNDSATPGSTLGDMVSAIFGGDKTGADVAKGFTARHRVLSGVILAAGVFYLYRRIKDKDTAF